MATSHSVEFAGGNLSGQRHICAFFNSTDEEHRALRSFIKDGFDRGDKAFHLVDAQLREEHLKRLAEAGINVQETMATGQLEVRPSQAAPPRGSRFDQDAWVVSFEQVLQSPPAAGYAQTRFLSALAWALVRFPGVTALTEFRVPVTYLCHKYDA